MYHQLLPLVRDLLTATGEFGTVLCGTGRGSYPLANVLLRASKPSSGRAVEEAALLVQIASADGDESETAYLETMELLAVAKAALHDARLPGHGAKKLQTAGIETLRVQETGEMIHYLLVSVLVDASSFTPT